MNPEQESRRAQFAKEPTHFIEVWKRDSSGILETELIKRIGRLKTELWQTIAGGHKTVCIFKIYPRITNH